MNVTHQYSTFFADQFHFAFDVDHVQEVVQSMPATPVPLTSDVVSGLVNLRGQIVTAIDLRARLQLPPREDDAQAVSLIVKTACGLLSVRADRLGDVLDSERMGTPGTSLSGAAPAGSESATSRIVLEPLPDTVQGPVREMVSGVIQLKDSLLLVLEPELLLTESLLRRHETEMN